MAPADRDPDHETVVSTTDGDPPRIALLGDSRYNITVTPAGGGVSRSGRVVINRWRNDPTRDAYGQWCYLANLGTGTTWSAGHQPLCAPYVEYKARLTPVSASIRRRDGDIETHTEIVALPDGTGEARRVSVRNFGEAAATIEFTSYQEVVLALPVNDRGHRAFGNLFVQTEWLPDNRAILAMRRPRSATEAPAWCGHAVATEDGSVSCETDRSRFVGRGRTSQNPVAMAKRGHLTGSVGAVLDPVLALRTSAVVPPGSMQSVVFSTFVASDRTEAVAHAAFLSSSANAGRSIAEAISLGDEPARRLLIDGDQARRFSRVAHGLMFGAGQLPRGTRDDLMSLGLAGEFPVLLARLRGENPGVDDILQFRAYMREKGIAVDIVFLTESPAARERLRAIIEPAQDSAQGGPGKAVVLDEAELSPSQTSLLESIARARADDGAVMPHA